LLSRDNSMNDFTEIQLNDDTIDTFYVRTCILKSITNNLSQFNGRLLDIGCGKMPYKTFILENSKVESYTGLDVETALVYDSAVPPDFTWNGIKMPFEDESFECAFGTEVLEHCPNPEIVLKEVYRILKPGGVFFFTVPFLLSFHEVPHDEYRYTPFSLERHFRNSGFIDVDIKATGGWHASMAQMLGLWIKRSPLPKRKRKWLMRLIKPVMRYLFRIDSHTNIQFKEGQMITGLTGIIKK
jgi:SAM-dependent methyltransferase